MSYHGKQVENGWEIIRKERKPSKRERRTVLPWLLSAAVGVLFVGCVFPRGEQENPSKAVSANAVGKVVIMPDFVNDFPKLKMEASTVTGTAENPAEYAEDFENEKIEAALLDKASVLENVEVTFYCCEKRAHICGTGDGLTATGNEVTPYVTVAVDPSVIPLGSEVMVDFGDGVIHYFIADDVGGAVKGNHIDIAVVSHEEALKLGIKTATVYWIGGEDNA